MGDQAKLKFENVNVVKSVEKPGKHTEQKKVLKNLDFSVQPREVFAVMGPSGSGKTTLLRLINRLEDPEKGAIYLDGNDVRDIPVKQLRKKVGFIQQLPWMFEGTVLDNLLYGPHLNNADMQAEKKRAEEMLPRFGFSKDILERDPERLSVGEKQRVCILRALMNRPEVLVMDEPTSALDERNVERILALVRDINEKEHTTIVLVTHIPEHGKAVATNSIGLVDGEIVARGPVGEVVRQLKTMKTFEEESEKGYPVDEELSNLDLTDESVKDV